MKRGIVTFTQNECALVHQMLDHHASLSDALQAKFITTSMGETERIQLSAEEAENILDILPPPTNGSSPEIASVRQKLLTFLST